MNLVYFVLLVSEQLLYPALNGKFSLINWRRLIANSGLNYSYSYLIYPFAALPMMMWATGSPLWQRPLWLPDGISLFIDILAVDFFLYWGHIAEHRVPFLWRFHAVHHLDETIDISTSRRSHYVDKWFLLFVRCAAAAIFAIPMEHMLLSELVVGSSVLLAHIEYLKFPSWMMSTIGRVIVTPAYHAVHHASELPYTNSNYSFIFCFWDNLFGTTFLRRPSSEMRRGLNAMPDLPLVELILEPLRPNPSFLESPTSEEKSTIAA